jgi:hypothetical protein
MALRNDGDQPVKPCRVVDHRPSPKAACHPTGIPVSNNTGDRSRFCNPWSAPIIFCYGHLRFADQEVNYVEDASAQVVFK